MRKKVLTVLLSLGALAGFTSGFHHMGRHCRRGMHHGPPHHQRGDRGHRGHECGAEGRAPDGAFGAGPAVIIYTQGAPGAYAAPADGAEPWGRPPHRRRHHRRHHDGRGGPDIPDVPMTGPDAPTPDAP